MHSKPFDTESVVISADRWERSAKNTPERVAQVDRTDIEFQEPQTSADVLGTTGEVYIQKSQLGGGSPMIRGFATNRVLLVVDGVRMNNAIFRGGNLQNVIALDPNAIEKSETVFGPGSMVYGSDAIGGVMAFQTLEPEPSYGDSLMVSGNAMTRYSSANDEYTGHLDVKLGGEKWASVTSFTYSRFGDQKMGSVGPSEYLREERVTRINDRDTVVDNEDPRIQKPTGYEQYNLMQKLHYRPTDSLSITYGLHYSESSDIPRYDRLTERKANGEFRNGEWYYGPQVWSMNQLKLEYRNSNILFDRLKMTGYYQTWEESRHDREFGSRSLRHRVENVGWGGLNLDFKKELSRNSRLLYGVDLISNKVNSEAWTENIENGSERAIGTRYPDGSTWDSYGAFAQFEHDFSDRLTVNAGARYDRVVLDASLDTGFYPFPFQEIDIKTGAPTGELGFIYHPTEQWTFRLNGSSGFRAPNIDDAAKVFDSEPGSVVVPNSDLGSERAYNVDLGVAKRFGDRLKVDVTGYYTLLENAMVRREFQYQGRDSIVYDGTLSNVQATKNVGSARVYGVQASLQAALGSGFEFEGHYNHTFGETSDGKSIRHVAPPFGKAQLTWQRKSFKAQFYADWNLEIPYEDLAPSEKGKPHLYARNAEGRPYSPGWYTLNVKASYSPVEFLRMSVGMENILDKRYRTYSSGVAAPGRNFIVSARGMF
jgi:hemoglobin/transferrin/lactoferrin receptor protein